VVLRQALLNVITYGLDSARGGLVEIGGIANQHQNGISIYAQSVNSGPGQPSNAQTALERSGIGLDVCQQLMATMKGHLAVENGDGQWQGSLTWPVFHESILLVVDDNQGIVDLFQRYLAGYNWQVIGATNAEGARQLLATVRPASIVLDIMMPKEDGWELLRTLKADPNSRHIPVIVCSVLKEPDLASMLGAFAYLPKPVSQAALLQVLAGHPP
jgi:CheY-like chemotaxis protein